MIALLLALGLQANAKPAPFELALDMGPVESDVFAGFKRIHPFGSDDRRASWTTPPKGAATTRWPDPLAGDGVHPSAVLHLDLPPGKHTIGVLMRDWLWTYTPATGVRVGLKIDGVDHAVDETPEGTSWFNSGLYAHNPVPRFKQGQTAWDRQVGPAQRWRTIVVNVGPNGVDVQGLGASMQALVAAPGNKAAELEVDLALLDAKRRDWFLKYKLPPVSSPPPPAAAGPLQVEVVAVGQAPDVGRANPTVTLSLAASAGERVAIPMHVHGGDDPLKVHLDGLESWSTTREMIWLDWNINGEVAPRPALLRPITDTLRGGQGVPPGLIWAIRVPDTARPGEHRASLSLSRDDERVQVNVTLRIRDLELHQPTAEVGTFVDLRPPVSAVYGQGSDDAWRVWDRDVEVLREHGVSAIALRFAYDHPRRGVARFGQELDASYFHEASRRWRQAGGNTIFWVDPFFSVRDPALSKTTGPLLPEGGEALLRQYAREVEDDPNMYLTIYDEHVMKYGFDYLSRGLQIADAFRAQSREVKLAAASPHPLTWRPFAGPYDLLFVHSDPLYSRKGVADIRAHGAIPWLYNPPFARESYGLVPWSLGTDGVIQWHVNEARSDPFDDLHPPRQYQLAVLAPGAQEIWPTLTLQELADGVVDQRYLVTLDALVRELRPRRNNKIRAAVADAEWLLQAARQGVDERHPRGDAQAVFSTTHLQLLRDEAADTAEHLARWSKQQRRARQSKRGR